MPKEISALVNKDNWELNTDYHFGKYAKVTNELITFINDFKSIVSSEYDVIKDLKVK